MAGENILVVDDNVAVQELIRAILEPNGYRVTVAANGVAALTSSGPACLLANPPAGGNVTGHLTTSKSGRMTVSRPSKKDSRHERPSTRPF